MKKSASVSLTLLAAVALGAQAGQRLDPCATASFNEQACQAALQNRGYCWRGRWVRMKYRQPFPYYYDAYQEFVESGGMANAAEVGSCGPPRGIWLSHGGSHGASHGGFGSTGGCHSAHA